MAELSWSVYWFMFPVCVVVASVAMFSGISGAALLTPLFLIGFPLLDVPRLTTVAAIGTSLFLETSGFGTGVYRYVRFRLVDVPTARALIAVTLPLGGLGAVVSRQVPAQSLRIGYGVAMVALAWVLARDRGGQASPLPAPALVAGSERSHKPCPEGEERVITSAAGKVFDFCAHGLGLQRLLSGAGAFVAGLISTGVGEATLPPLVRRSHFPVPVAAATSTVVVAGTVVGAATTHLVQLAAEDGLSAIPWNLIVWAVPGAVLGAAVGTRLQGRVSEDASRRFFTLLFLLIGVTFLVAFTAFRSRFG
ncbi:MAG: sulfite exporter TauE/SafE family protein [Acidimicrobiales bacterium]